MKLFLQYFGPGDHIIFTSLGNSNVYVQGRITKEGKHAWIVVNKTDRQQSLVVRGPPGARVSMVDGSTHDKPWKEFDLESKALTLNPFAVAVVHFMMLDELPLAKDR